jgi:predicted exporter
VKFRGGVGAWLVCLWLVACGGVLVWKFQAGLPIDTDIQSMLPETGNDPVEREAMIVAGKTAAARAAFLISAPDSATSAAAADDLTKRLTEGNLFTADTADASTTGRYVFANRGELLCERDPKAFNQAAADKVEKRALAEVYSPTGVVNSDLLRQDPYLITTLLAACLPPTSAANLPETSRLVSGRISSSAYRMDSQGKIVDAFAAWRAAWAPKGVTAARAGAVFHADAAAQRAQTEMTLIGTIGSVGVALLFFLAFLRISHVGWGFLLVSIGLVPGFAVVLLMFKTVHVLVLVFAAMLIGIVSDYAVHTLATGPALNWPAAKARIAEVGRPISVSMVTSCLGFAALAMFGVPLFQEVAVLSVVGITSAWAFVMVVLLHVDGRPKRGDFYRSWWLKLERMRDGVKLPGWIVWPSSAVLLALMAYGATQITILDDVRKFQPRPADLMAEEQQLTAAGYGGSGVTFLLSQGATLEEAKQNQEAALTPAPPGARILATTRFDPSAVRRAQNVAAQSILYGPMLAKHAEAIGLDPGFKPQAAKIDAKAPGWLTELEGHTDKAVFLIAPVLDAAGWTGPTGGATRLIDPAAEYSNAFAAYRGDSVLALIAAFGCAIVVTWFVYRRVAALTILIPPILAAIAALLVPAAFGQPITFFSLAAALVLVGTGIDYSAFQWEGGAKHDDTWTGVAVFIDAATTLLSMGLLALSETIPVRSFGLTVSVGIAAALALSHIPRWAAQREMRRNPIGSSQGHKAGET